MKILYKPFGLLVALIGARLGKAAFGALWARIDDTERPNPTTEQASVQKIVGGAALEAATMAAVGAAVDRAGAKGFHYLTGIWPGEQSKKKD